MNNKVLIYNFHGLDAGQNKNKGRYSYLSYPKSQFKSLLALIHELGLPVISLSEITSNKVTNALSVAFTFDDGNDSDYYIAYPLLSKYNFPAAFFIPSRIREGSSVTWQQLREMAKDPLFTIGSHGQTHAALCRIPEERLMAELRDSKKEIEDALSETVKYLALPFGLYNQKTLRKANDCGYDALLTTQTKLNVPSRFSYLLHRWPVYRQTSMAVLRNWLEPSPWHRILKPAEAELKFRIRRVLSVLQKTNIPVL